MIFLTKDKLGEKDKNRKRSVQKFVWFPTQFMIENSTERAWVWLETVTIRQSVKKVYVEMDDNPRGGYYDYSWTNICIKKERRS